MTTRIVTTAVLTLALAACGSADSTDPARPNPASTKTASRPALSFDVFVGDAKGFLATSTLIMGERNAVLVDAQFNLANGRRLAAWVAGKGKRLEAIYITHAHPDHYFGVEEVLAKFPGTPIYASAGVVAHMRTMAPQKLAYWGPLYKDDLTKAPPLARALDNNVITLEGRELRVLPVDQADASPSTMVHVPSIGLVVAGDLTYQGVHPWLAEVPTPAQRQGWLASLRALAKLEPVAVVAGHRVPGARSTTSSIAETTAYIEDFDRLRAESKDAATLTSAMLQRYPKHQLPIILQLAAKAAF